MQQNVLLTEEGLIKLKNELADLKQQRKVVISRIQAARELGDISENADYDDARNTQSFVEGRIQEIESMLEHAKVVSKSAKGDGKITIGSQVTVTVEGDQEVYELVGVNESDPAAGKISIDSPLGKALLGLKSGESVQVATPAGKLEYQIAKVA